MKPSDTPLIEATDLACGYPDRSVLSGINFRVDVGEVVGVLGPNGSGKSTLFRTLIGALPPTNGSIQLVGDSLDSLKPKEIGRRVGFVPQDEAHTFPYTVRQVVLTGRMVHHDGLWETPEDHRVAEESMKVADCLEYADRSILELSGGESQRVLLARCLAQETPLILMDEPTSHSDFAHQVGLAEIACRLVGQGRGIAVALHDLNQAFLMCTRCVLLSRGKVLADGIPSEVLTPAILKQAYDCDFEYIIDDRGKTRVFPTLPYS